MSERRVRYVVGIDLGTTHTVVGFVDLTRGSGAPSAPIQVFAVEQLVGPGQVAAALVSARTNYADFLPLKAERLAALGAYVAQHTKAKEDRWTPVTQDGNPGALFTAVVRVRADGCDVLTPFLP